MVPIQDAAWLNAITNGLLHEQNAIVSEIETAHDTDLAIGRLERLAIDTTDLFPSAPA